MFNGFVPKKPIESQQNLFYIFLRIKINIKTG